MKNKKLYNYLPNLIISLFLAFIFLALSLLFAADNIFFEPTTYTNSMYKIKIEDTAFEEIQTYCEQQYAYTGVEADTLKKSINKTDVSNAIYSYVEDLRQTLRFLKRISQTIIQNGLKKKALNILRNLKT